MSDSLREVCGPALGKLGKLLDEIRSLLVVLVEEDEEAMTVTDALVRSS